MPLPLLVAMILAFGLGDRAGDGPVPAREAMQRLYELGLGIVAVAALAFALGALFAWAIRRRGSASRPLRRGVLWGLRAVDALGLAVFGWSLERLEWPRIVAWNLGLRDWILLDELLILAPFLLMQLLGWWGLYPAEHALRPSRSGRGIGRHLGLRARQALGMMLPLVLVYGLGSDLVRRLFPGRADNPWVQLGALASMSGLVLILAPGMVRLWWPTRPLPSGPLRNRLERLARRFRFRFTDILVWDTDGLAVNAVVTGSVPWFRYVLLTDAMVEDLDADQIEAVFGHEIGHVAHRHLLDFGLFVVGSAGVAALIEAAVRFSLADGPVGSGWFGRPEVLQVIRTLAALGLLAGYFVLIFGLLSRRFERQADIFGCRAVSCGRPDCPPHMDPNALPVTTSPPETPCPAGIQVFASALEDVAALNGLSRRAPSWRHGSIAERIAYVESLTDHPEAVRRFQAGVARLRIALGLILLATSAAAVWVLGTFSAN
jgi:STE24 endopeptidase